MERLPSLLVLLALLGLSRFRAKTTVETNLGLVRPDGFLLFLDPESPADTLKLLYSNRRHLQWPLPSPMPLTGISNQRIYRRN